MTGLSFGTSGLRGLVVDLVGEPARAWTRAFLAHLDGSAGRLDRTLLVGRDLRSSSPGIADDCLAAAAQSGWRALDCGALPTPALALAARARGCAAVMVTGSHIPDDRNGLKFYAPGEITKDDERSIRQAFGEAQPAGPGSHDGAEDISRTVLDAYRRRYLDAFPADALKGQTIGVYEQSSVARDLLHDILQGLGASTVALGRSERFIPVDTEAHRPDDLDRLRQWAGAGDLTAIVSTDGDADRPLLADGTGAVLRGDVLGLLAALHLGCRTVVTPVTSSGAVERCGVADRTVRTRVGSPFVIEAMQAEIDAGSTGVIGFEANGGVLLGTPASLAAGSLDALPTRDAMLPILCALAEANSRALSVRALADTLRAGHALADRLTEIATERSAPFLHRLASDDAFAADALSGAGPVAARDTLDGVRFRLEDGAILHFRASGNAPELRVYVEGDTAARAQSLLAHGLALARAQTNG